MAWERINKVGLELEGAWGEVLFEEPFIEEVSLPVPVGYVRGKHHWGEIVSPPLTPPEAIKWLDKHYPTLIPPPEGQGTDQERSAGFHIHLSFHSNLDYATLMSRAFYNQWLGDMEEWGKKAKAGPLFDSRLEGKNRFARRIFRPRAQVGQKLKDSGVNASRRTLLNYPHALHTTIESRLFPMFPDKAMGLSALRATMDCFHNYLEQHKPAVSPQKLRMLVGDARRAA